uniref:Leucine zipper protein 2 n=1 Tax=Rattus norvegicus TaxID=10116 RepID=A0ABK0LMJ2_RAT
MKFNAAHYLLPLLPALVLSTRQDYEELEKQLKEVFKERSTVLRQLTKTSRELDGIKVNLQSLKNDEQSSKTDVQKLLELGQKQREEMKSLQEALQNQLKETSEKAEKHQATINFLKTEVERKSKMIRDLQNEVVINLCSNAHGFPERGCPHRQDHELLHGQLVVSMRTAVDHIEGWDQQDDFRVAGQVSNVTNKSLKNKLLSGSKLCGIHAEESKKIQAQLKELRYGKKDLLFKAQQLTELEQKLAVAKNELEKAALDRESQMKAMKETVQLCLSSVFRDQPPPLSLFPSNPTQMLHPPRTIASRIPETRTKSKPQQSSPGHHDSSQVQATKEESRRTTVCGTQDEGSSCLAKHEEGPKSNNTAESELTTQKLQMPLCSECEEKKVPEKTSASFDGTPAREEKLL